MRDFTLLLLIALGVAASRMGSRLRQKQYDLLDDAQAALDTLLPNHRR
jgi:hypothetical protein